MPVRAALRLEVLTIDRDRAARSLLAAPATLDEARTKGRDWLRAALGDMTLRPTNAAEATVLARAVVTLLFNTTAAPGLMEGRLASYPSRGGYPTHFLWDACFHMLALENMHPRLARDALLLLSDCMRPDGLMPHFICSTWIRPIASQPPLFGWAAERLVTRTKDLELAANVLPLMHKNTEWWLTQRMTTSGLIACFDPFETGWDDTPRLDDGPIIACDMNAYLLMQMRSAARIAALLGDAPQASALQERADAFAARMLAVLHDPVTNRFHDVLLSNGRKLPILSPACFLPLLGNMPLPKAQQLDMITRDLLDPARLNGEIPFPCVAYDDPAYNPAQMWRGPMWPPIYWLLLELLDQFGLVDVRKHSAQRLYQIILSDGYLHEYFNSQTGVGLGFPQQGWTAAILLRLHAELKGQNA
jgi:glycogen debranching enzyme